MNMRWKSVDYNGKAGEKNNNIVIYVRTEDKGRTIKEGRGGKGKTQFGNLKKGNEWGEGTPRNGNANWN
jgi:hypothetical protein